MRLFNWLVLIFSFCAVAHQHGVERAIVTTVCTLIIVLGARSLGRYFAKERRQLISELEALRKRAAEMELTLTAVASLPAKWRSDEQAMDGGDSGEYGLISIDVLTQAEELEDTLGSFAVHAPAGTKAAE